MQTQNQAHARLRSSLADAAFAVEERVVWGGRDALRGGADALRWPFERAAWAIERGLIWPLEERTGDWSGPLRNFGVAALVLLAAGAGVLGLVWASGSGGAAQTSATASSATPAPIQPASKVPEQAAPVLHGATPDFTLEGVGGDSKVADGGSTTADAATSTTGSAASASTASAGEPAGPAAIKVAHRFAGAFVLYETGQDNAKVRIAFGETATPQLARTLLRRPPRLPADVEVPQAKVLNIVPGPSHGDTYTLSVSLLRVGITSELRIDMQRDKQSGDWQVTDARG